MSQNYLISGYRPESLFHYFEDISRIPRGSGNESGIADYLCDFARSRGLFCLRDKENNVFMRKEASPGYADHPAVLLQGHTDMVCEKNAGTVHDFLRDPLDLYIEDGWLRARGTTLGGDDGAAVAIMLALLDDGGLAHPMLECLFTTGEETRMTGADAFDYSVVQARKLINLDSESEGVVTVSCAGSADVTLNYPADRIRESGRSLKVSVKGLAGGHSGAEIHLGRGNANRILARLLAVLYDDTPFHLISVFGGSKRNAIPREAGAEICVPDEKKAAEILLAEEAEIRAELPDADSDFRVHVGKGSIREEMFSYKDTSAVLNLLLSVPDGVIAMSPAVKDFVRTSSNIGVVTTDAAGVHAGIMVRSSCDSEMDAALLILRRLAKLIGAGYVLEDRHAGWELCPDSALTRDYVETWKALYPEKEPVVCGIHAGLECGIILSKLDGKCDAISIGPDMRGIHTPGEALSLASCERTYKLVAEMLRRG